MAYQLTPASQHGLTEQLVFMDKDVECLEKLLDETRLMVGLFRKWTTTGVLSSREVQSAKSFRDAALALVGATEPLEAAVSQVERLASQVRADFAGALVAVAEAVEDGEYPAELIAE